MAPLLFEQPVLSSAGAAETKMGRLHASLLLLAGGQGSRMGGRNKLYLEVEGSLLIEKTLRETSPIFSETLLLVACGESESVRRNFASLIERYNVTIVEDRTRGVGPLEGLCRGLSHMKEEWGFLLGCDMPTPQEDTIRGLSAFCAQNSDAVVAELHGYLEPLHAFYRKSCVVAVARAIERSDRKIKQFYKYIRLTAVKEEALTGDYARSFLNLNTPHDIETMILHQGVN